ncbi:phage tail assembly chaperone [Pseudoruegeria sp. HB172150]|uniref:phage tail assembly chaperone n=1 Tax=Pseudoruegeria sp. HB172150 TaxID=2721164 RepID=UPI001556AF6D|nr:phage tail assembly chaperone [Pseudoruegeria sp. HB172150]
MTFKIVTRPEFTRPVEVTMPDETVQVLQTTFRGMPEDEAVEKLSGTRHDIEAQKRWLREVVACFSDVEDPETGTGVPEVGPDDPLFELIISQACVRIAVMRVYGEGMAGVKGVRRGN